MSRPATALGILAALLAAVDARADSGYTVPRLGEPALGSDRGLLLEGAGTAPAWAVWSGFQAGYDYGAGLPDGASRVTGTASLGLGLPAGFEVALGFGAGATSAAREPLEPTAGAVPDGGRTAERDYRGLGDTGFGIGDLRLSVLWSRPVSGPGGFRWLLGFEAGMPTGDHDLLLGEDGFTWKPFVGAAFEAFGARLVGNLGYRFRPAHVAVIDGRRFEQNDDLLWGVGFGFERENDIVWFVEAVGAIGVATADGPWPGSGSRPVLLGGGVDWPLARLWRMGINTAVGVAGDEPPLVSIGLRLFSRPLELDEDLDGIPWWRDDCPLLPGPESNRGCPVVDDHAFDDDLIFPGDDR